MSWMTASPSRCDICDCNISINAIVQCNTKINMYGSVNSYISAAGHMGPEGSPGARGEDQLVKEEMNGSSLRERYFVN